MIYFDERLYNLIIFLSSLFEWFACMAFINRIRKKQTAKSKYIIFSIIVISVIVIIKILNYLLAGELEILGYGTVLLRVFCKMAVLFVSYLYIKAVYKCPVTNILLASILPVLMLCISNIIYILIKISAQLFLVEHLWLFTLVFMAAFDFLFIIFLYFASSFAQKQKFVYYKKDTPLIIVSFLTSMAIIIYSNLMLLLIKNVTVNEFMITIISIIAIFVMDVIIIKLILRAAKLNRIQKENELKLIGQGLEQQYAKNIKEQDEIFRRMRHDFKHHMCVIDALISNNKIDEAKNYLKDYIDSTNINTYVDTGNEYVNAILNSKISHAKNNGINITSVIAGNVNGVDNIDVCNLLGNLLDNAIESCSLTDEKRIVLKIMADEQMIRISVSNTIRKSVLSENTELKTSKADSQNHGFGTKTVKEIAGIYNGFADYFEDNSNFFANITLVKQNN